MPEFRDPQWKQPTPLGYGLAADMFTSVAAPILAGFSVAAIGVISADFEKFLWPGFSLLALTAAVVLLVASMQFGFHAKSLRYSPSDIHAWWSAEDLMEPGRKERICNDQHRDFEKSERWDVWARQTYNFGICALALGVAAALPPPEGASGAQAALRWAAAALALFGVIAELAWIAGDTRLGHWLARRLR
ncbi:hypothetical protein ACFVZN_04130 [Streptomyces virginiae]|uniref:hypothetical protein n=1 Tax=Streptomyces virginiae TaxID=1961 RepID=UPI0036CAA83A